MKKIRLSYTNIATIAIVLGLIVKMAGPPSAEASAKENISELIDSLVQVRTNLDLFRVQHKGLLPPVDSFANFENAVTKRVGCYGPYMNKIPMNPFNGLNTVRFDGEPAGTNKAGWRLDTKTGLFQADNDAAHAAL